MAHCIASIWSKSTKRSYSDKTGDEIRDSDIVIDGDPSPNIFLRYFNYPPPLYFNIQIYFNENDQFKSFVHFFNVRNFKYITFISIIYMYSRNNSTLNGVLILQQSYNLRRFLIRLLMLTYRAPCQLSAPVAHLHKRLLEVKIQAAPPSAISARL